MASQDQRADTMSSPVREKPVRRRRRGWLLALLTGTAAAVLVWRLAPPSPVFDSVAVRDGVVLPASAFSLSAASDRELCLRAGRSYRLAALRSGGLSGSWTAQYGRIAGSLYHAPAFPVPQGRDRITLTSPKGLCSWTVAVLTTQPDAGRPQAFQFVKESRNRPGIYGLFTLGTRAPLRTGPLEAVVDRDGAPSVWADPPAGALQAPPVIPRKAGGLARAAIMDPAAACDLDVSDAEAKPTVSWLGPHQALPPPRLEEKGPGRLILHDSLCWVMKSASDAWFQPDQKLFLQLLRKGRLSIPGRRNRLPSFVLLTAMTRQFLDPRNGSLVDAGSASWESKADFSPSPFSSCSASEVGAVLQSLLPFDYGAAGPLRLVPARRGGPPSRAKPGQITGRRPAKPGDTQGAAER